VTRNRTPDRTLSRRVGRLRDRIVPLAAGLALVYLLLPNLVVVLFSFNAPAGRFNATWRHASLAAWLHPCAAPGMCASLGLSLRIAVLATLVSTALGTPAAFALARHRFRGATPVGLLVLLPLAVPEVVMGASLLTLFVSLRVPLGFWTILLAHVTFCTSFVVVTVRARLTGLDPALEQAAHDLYASGPQTFLRVTLPLVAPGIGAAALLSFAISFDDFVVTDFNAAPDSVTFPMYVWGAAARGTPVQINVIGTLLFVLALVAVGVSRLAGRSPEGGRR
jgi:spermidine/putrescine transport system permease protein